MNVLLKLENISFTPKTSLKLKDWLEALNNLFKLLINAPTNSLTELLFLRYECPPF